VPRLPDNASAEHLKGQAKAYLKRLRAGDGETAAQFARHHPDPPADPKLADVQLALARAYGFPSWPRLRQHLDTVALYSRSPHTLGRVDDAAGEFLRLACLTYGSDDPARREAARALLAARPELARASLHAAAAAGDAAATRELLARGSSLNELGGPHRWEPLLYLAYSRVGGDGSLDVARQLLDAGADPNAGYLWAGLTSPFTALTGAFGHGEGDPPPHRDALALARLLLEAGAEPTDAQAVYNLHWTPGDAWLELLLEFGFGRGDGGPWRARLAPELPPPEAIAEDALMWAAGHGFAHRVQLLLDAGVSPDRPASHPILGGRTPLEQALLQGHEDVVAVLRAAGAREPELDERERLEVAYMRGEEDIAAPPPPGLVVRAAENRRPDVVRLVLSRGADVDERDDGRTALHAAAWNDDAELVELLIERGADPSIRDDRFDATPAGWAEHHGHTELAARLLALEP
jgi:ankyrin repeat protein